MDFRYVKESREPLAVFTTAVIGTIIVYIFGILGLLRYFSFWNALEHGLFPFMPGDMLKILFVFAILYIVYPSTKQVYNSGLTDRRNKIWNIIIIVFSIGTFAVFFGYLYSNGNNIPIFLPEISIFSAVCLIPGLIFVAKKNKNIM